ncbi:hypothetical protein F1847_06130 [Thermodesulfobacterium sp. TA1]|uniref:hypothetical protein n=1 Tax=Thermodesulfobacterium sp. TA1 TaxID=2234087 RepID=UPI001232A19F|nr:hypothetical protein [Thermodesulfobacterium sp. TA1]QER42341.1 hypothetical protein F1847_06130 [Thermodesulfobacterium sp. TA1]
MEKTQQNETQLPVLCATCAWREVCAKKFSFDNTQPLKCPDYSPDVKLLKNLRKETEVDKTED